MAPSRANSSALRALLWRSLRHGRSFSRDLGYASSCRSFSESSCAIWDASSRVMSMPFRLERAPAALPGAAGLGFWSCMSASSPDRLPAVLCSRHRPFTDSHDLSQICARPAYLSLRSDCESSYKSTSSNWRNLGALLCGGCCTVLGVEVLLEQLESIPIQTQASHQSDQSLVPNLLAARLAESFIEELSKVCDKERIVSDLDDRSAHGKPWNTYHKLDSIPDVVVYPKSAEEVVAIVKLCDNYKVPLTAYGAATSLEGHTLTPYGGVSLDMTLMKAVKELHLDDMDVVVEPGIGWIELNEYLKPYGLFFPLDPGTLDGAFLEGPGATIGGMCATRCSGSLAVRYGTMRENVISLKAVMANGDVVKTAARARKSAAGYDLTRLLIGSEGTLGVITEVTLRLQKIPEASTVAMCNFPSIGDAADVAIAIMHSGIQRSGLLLSSESAHRIYAKECVDEQASRIELLDDVMMKAVNLGNGTNYPEEPTLMFELIGTEAYALEQTQLVQKIAEKHSASDFIYAISPEEKVKLWKIRKEAFWCTATLKEGAEAMVTDVCVPLSKLAECISTAKSQLDASKLITCILSHAGDGNFHALILFDPQNKDEVDEAHRLQSSMVHTALALEGTCTGEHGVGVGKMQYLEEELGHEAMKVMGSIKGALDPGNIMNPGKVIPPRFCY